MWAWASNTGGYDVQAMVKATAGTSSLDPEKRDKTVKYLVNQMDRLLGYRRPTKARVGIVGTQATGRQLACFSRLNELICIDSFPLCILNLDTPLTV